MKKLNTLDSKELEATTNAMLEASYENDSALSGYLGSKILGGPYCIELEKEWAEVFSVRHAIAVNSGTSGLLAACMAIDICHDSEVIVSP